MEFRNCFGDEGGFGVGTIERLSANVASLIRLNRSRDHRFRQAFYVLSYERSGGFHDTFATAEVFLKPDRFHRGIAFFKGNDVGDVSAPPLVDRLIVVSHHTDIGPCLGKQIDYALLNRIHILVFIYNLRA